MSTDIAIFYNHLAQTSPHPLGISISKAEGVYLFSPSGKKYIDFISGIGVSNIGHRHPKVITAIKEQLDKHMHVMVYGEYIQSTPNQLAEKLNKITPKNINSFYFVNSGTEANEAALKLAKRYTQRTEIISFNNSYHGNTHGSLSVSGNEIKKNSFRPLLPNIKFIEFNKEKDLTLITSKTAGVIIETIQGDAGVQIPSNKYMKALRKRCDDTGALLIMDEIQTGFGRTGSFWAFEHFNIVPDILTMAKAMGGGLPIGCFAANKTVMNTLSYMPELGHITTFGGNPVCCAASLATIEVIQEENLLETVEEKGKLIEKLLHHHSIIEIRRKGLLFAIEFESAELVNKIVKTCIDNGVICYWFLSNPHAFRIAPPLTINENEIKTACAIILSAINLHVNESPL
ncbi:MAG: aspartate aminotransferase family protein [Cyclobacteriaceae bacterium]|nr:aspartate aminotransferase family protein [Cyclobacteriaceae bacterium]